MTHQICVLDCQQVKISLWWGKVVYMTWWWPRYMTVTHICLNYCPTFYASLSDWLEGWGYTKFIPLKTLSKNICRPHVAPISRYSKNTDPQTLSGPLIQGLSSFSSEICSPPISCRIYTSTASNSEIFLLGPSHISSQLNLNFKAVKRQVSSATCHFGESLS